MIMTFNQKPKHWLSRLSSPKQNQIENLCKAAFFGRLSIRLIKLLTNVYWDLTTSLCNGNMTETTVIP